MMDSYVKVGSDKVRRACANTLGWIKRERQKEMDKVDAHNGLRTTWWKRLTIQKWTGEDIKYHYWNQELTCERISKASLSSDVVYLSSYDAEYIGVSNVD